MTSFCGQFILGDKREVYFLNKSALPLPVSEEESVQEGKKNIISLLLTVVYQTYLNAKLLIRVTIAPKPYPITI